MPRGARLVERITDMNGRGAPKRPAPDKSSPDDKLNRSIIAMLQSDGRMPFSEMAQALKVSEGTIRNRVNGMKEAGLLRIVAIADPVAAEYQADAIIGLKVASGFTPKAVADRLGAEQDVVYVLWVAGRFDLIVEIVSDDRDSFLAFLDKEIHGAADIAEVEVMFGLKNFKNQFLLKRDWEAGHAE